MTKFHVHLVSDSTGETVHGIARACISQFEGVEAEEHQWPLMRTVAQLEKVIDQIKEKPGVVMYTLVNDEMRQTLHAACRRYRIPCISILDPVINFLINYLGVKSKGEPGRQHSLDAEYFSRIDAMHFALAHDDGQGLWNLNAADVILVGVSRTSKTPTCVYLANRGIKAGNVPFVPGLVPEELKALDNRVNGPLVVGLTKEPGSLVQLRRSRLRMISDDEETDYVDLDEVKKEVIACRRLCTDKGWPVLDVTRRSIEETAAAVVRLRELRDAKRRETKQ
ncbi:pyruvate, water dikinase regulatory protein [Aestuariispira insulae]|uniref:Putative pyruvate, phosphate dikinase regulatory protein n=1 Tax=Aestuariispira insulae TaxID=1461337 RepID=A0A3D9HR40_9PROT|nr:pyruvate, water dikinase regulatory protein [Aestuariispira insulae]RED51366.1 hypothetical protein DFP90_103166 [Aestuariispira insulae]